MRIITPRQAVISGLSFLFILTALAPLFAAPDLDVCYISRTPRYRKYNPTYQDHIDPRDQGKSRPVLSKEEQNMKRWPAKGELVTFTALVKNPGHSPTGEFTYKWFFDGKEVGSGTLPSIEPGGQVSTTYQWNWDSEWNDHYIKFTADPDNKIAEEIETNNTVENRTNALTYRFHAWKKLYDWFRTDARKINPDMASFDDWCQLQMREMNRIFSEAVYPTSPRGILERVCVDEVVVEPEGTPDPDPGACHAPSDWEWDGRWGFAWDPYHEIFTQNPDFIKGVYTWGLHEHSHQMGMFDLYQLNIEYKDNNHIEPEIGHVITRTGGVMASSGSTHYSDHTAAFFNANLHKRRGYFGEFLYDVPDVCKIKLEDAYYNPLANATIKFYQTEGRQIVNSVAFTGTTDSDGLFTMPNRDCYGEVTTATGHHLHNNPWGMINVVGLNGIFFCEITKDGQTDYQYIEILPFNMAYYQGHKNEWTYEMQTSIVPKNRVTTNDLYGIKMVNKKLGYAVGAKGTILRWDGHKWQQMKSPVNENLRAVDVSPNGKIICAVGDNGAFYLSSRDIYNTTGKDKQIVRIPARMVTTPVTGAKTLRACAVMDDGTVIVGGDDGFLKISTDFGMDWKRLDAVDAKVRSIRFADTENGIMTCDGGKTYYTTDGGMTWAAGSNAGDRNLLGASMPTTTEAWACNDNGDVYQSTDGGRTWTRFTEFGYALPWQCIDMKPGGSGWVLGDWHRHYGTTVPYRLDNYQWFSEYVDTYGESGCYYGVSCISNTEAWAVGKGGLILHLVGGRNW